MEGKEWALVGLLLLLPTTFHGTATMQGVIWHNDLSSETEHSSNDKNENYTMSRDQYEIFISIPFVFAAFS